MSTWEFWNDFSNTFLQFVVHGSVHKKGNLLTTRVFLFIFFYFKANFRRIAIYWFHYQKIDFKRKKWGPADFGNMILFIVKRITTRVFFNFFFILTHIEEWPFFNFKKGPKELSKVSGAELEENVFKIKKIVPKNKISITDTAQKLYNIFEIK